MAQLRGVEVGSPVVVIGTLIRTGEGIRIAADVVAGGTRSDYLAAQGGVTALPILIGGALAASALSGMAVLYSILSRRHAQTKVAH